MADSTPSEPGPAAPAGYGQGVSGGIGKPIKVAIVGGGMAGLTAAFELSRPRMKGKDESRLYEHTDEFDITVYQLGWRLGGKGASGRNAQTANRIEEHGLHVWMGFYENAFRVVRACYEELHERNEHPEKFRRPDGQHSEPPGTCALKDWTDAFFPDPHVGVANQLDDRTWEAWTAWFPVSEDQPGDPLDEDHNPFTLASYVERAALLLRSLMQSVLTIPADPDDAPRKRSEVDVKLDQGKLDFSAASPGLIVDAITRVLRVGSLTTAAGLLQGLLILETILRQRHVLPGNDYRILEFFDAILRNARRQLEDVVKIDPRLRRKTELIDLVMTTIAGVLRDDLLSKPDGLDAIDHVDARDWLESHGATYSSLVSPFMRGLYDMAFADAQIDGQRTGLSAGQALRCAMRLFFTCRGALFWRMRSSMGEVVFAPLYRLLKARGVKFEFFHRLEAINIDWNDAHPYITELEFDVQARLNDAQAGYQPLTGVKRNEQGEQVVLHAWSAQPDWNQLDDATDRGRDFESFWDRRRVGEPVTLRYYDDKSKRHDFHFVILAVGLGAIPHLTGNFLDARAGQDAVRRWRAALDNVKTIPTQAFQLWLRNDMASLGWSEPPVTLSGWVDPFDTWSDMTHILGVEQWKGEYRPAALAYFCGALSELPRPQPAPPERNAVSEDGRAFEAEVERGVKQAACNMLQEQIAHLWPGVMRDNGTGKEVFDWTRLSPETGLDRADITQARTMFWTAGLNPSDRYVLTVPGSARYRLSPLDDMIANLVVAGDWTACGFIGGCIEAAVMSGQLASHALCGRPRLDQIIGYDHP